MIAKECKVTFQPSGRSVFVLPGTILLEAAGRAGHIITTPCGGAGTCGKCLVRVISGVCDERGDAPTARLTPEQRADGWRLACRCRVLGELVVEIPDRSLFQPGAQILVARGADNGVALDAGIRCAPLDVTPSAGGDLERAAAALSGAVIPLEVLRELPGRLRGDGPQDALVRENRVVHIGRRGTIRPAGLAVDVGTTTVVAALVDFREGRDLAVVSAVNPQTSLGDDVVTRIRRCREEPDGTARLQGAILDCVNRLAAEALKEAGLKKSDVADVVLAGNTCMQHLLVGVSPAALGEMPFTPAFLGPLDLRARDIGLDLLPEAGAWLMPHIGGFVGGDTVAGMLATMPEAAEGVRLLVDVGTNGEIVLAHGGCWTATSVAAGPAFEGARIVQGMRAVRGAIEKVVLDGDVQVNVIGNAKPVGLCGTGLVDAVACLLRHGLLDSTGRIREPAEAPVGLPEALSRRLVQRGSSVDFVLAWEDESESGERICVHQRDIRELQLANAAIAAGIRLLLEQTGCASGALLEVMLAGGFGNFIRRNNALRIGMLPPVVPTVIRFVGNSSLAGARLALLSQTARRRAVELARATRHLDLSRHPGFQDVFAEAMLFPEA